MKYTRCEMGKMWLLLVWNQARQVWVPLQYSFYRIFVEEIEQRLYDNDIQSKIVLTDYEPDVFDRDFVNC